MSKPSNNGERFHEAQRAVTLVQAAPKMLDALRLIRFAVLTDHDSDRDRVRKVLALCEAALQGTEDL